ncbi:hypothetical protein Tco_0180137 [Tanacetum coccineum]
MWKIRKWDDQFRPLGRLTWINIMGVPVSCWNESIFKKIATVHGTIMDTSNCCLAGNQSVTVGKVMIHTISPDLIREVVHVNVKKRTYKVVVVEEINDVIEIDVDQKTSEEEEEGGGENSFVTMGHGMVQDDNGQDEDESDDGHRPTDNGNKDDDDEGQQNSNSYPKSMRAHRTKRKSWLAGALKSPRFKRKI